MKDLIARLRDTASSAMHAEAADALERLIAERDALKADAKRYQWITKQITSDTFDNLEKAFGVFGDAESCTQAEFDACIDTAMQEANHG